MNNSYIVRERLQDAAALAAYPKGGTFTAEIPPILAAEFCQSLIAPSSKTIKTKKPKSSQPLRSKPPSHATLSRGTF